MRKLLLLVALIFLVSILYGCDKEKIITTTETVHETEYIELPPDTVLIADTIYQSDSVVINITDTLFVNTTDTLILNNTDTLYFSNTDTLFVNTTDTLTVYDTIHETHMLIDTLIITVTDTVIQNSAVASSNHAYTALQYYTDPAVLQFINTEFGIADGWVFYLSTFQNELTNPSEGVYDFFGFIDYWTPDWSSYYPLEYYWRVTFKGGDPADPQNWYLVEPPATVNGKSGGLVHKTNGASSTLK